MFLSYRTVGYIIDNNKPILKKFGTENFLYSTVGRSWQVHNANHIRLKLSSPERESQISSIAVTDKMITCTAVGNQILLWKRVQETARITPPTGNAISKLMTIGNYLISLSKDGHLYVWDLTLMNNYIAEAQIHEVIDDTSLEKQGKGDKFVKGTHSSDNLLKSDIGQIPIISHAVLTPPPSLTPQKTTVKHQFGLESQNITTTFDTNAPQITSWCHPPTYNNKLLIGWSNGVLELWNINSGKMIHRFESHYQTGSLKRFKNEQDQHSKSQIQKSAGLTPLEKTLKVQSGALISCLEPSYILDVVAVGKSNGDIVLLNLKSDQVIHVFNQHDTVSSLSFRSDNNFHHLVSGSMNGTVTLWDLKEKTSILRRECHSNHVTGAFFLFKEPILITTGADNCIHQWHFDGITMRPLRSKEGHHKPPTNVRWYSHREIISGSPDGSLRYWSPARDRSAKSLSWKFIPNNAHRSEKGDTDGYLAWNQRRVTGIDLTPMYHPSRPSAVTLNTKDTDKVTLWEVENFRATKVIGQSTSNAVETCFSYCGQFVFIAYENGEVKKFNIQSNALRCSFTPDRVITNTHGDEAIKSITSSAISKKNKRLKAMKTGQIIEKSNAYGVNPHQHGMAGLFCGVGNEYLISIGKDGLMYTWDIDREAMLRSFDLEAPIHNVHFSSEHSLLGVITSNNEIYLIDCERLCIVRQWTDIVGRIDKILLHPHSALMFVTDIQGGVRTYDLTSGMIIDHTIFSRPITSIDNCSPSRDSKSAGDMIATTHAGAVGVYLWILNPNRHVSTALTVHQHFMGNKSNPNAGVPTTQIQLSGGNTFKSIDNTTLEKEQKRFQKEQAALYAEHQKHLNELLLNDDNDQEEPIYTNQMSDSDGDGDDDDGDDDDDEGQFGKGQYQHKLNKQERLYYKKMKQSDHFLTVNVVRNMSRFDALITKPKANKADVRVDPGDSEELKLAKAQRIMQQVLFKQLHNEMNTKLAMLSGLASSRWKLITQQQAIAQRNERLKQAAIMANKNTPFFLNNIQLAQKKNDSHATYTLESGTTLLEQERAIKNAKNSDFSYHNLGKNAMGLGGDDDQPTDLIQHCLLLNTVANLSDYIWEQETRDIFAPQSDDEDDIDNVLVSVNDKTYKEQLEKKKKEEDDKKNRSKREIALEKLKIEKEKKEKMEKKLKKQKEKQDALNRRKDLAAQFIRWLYLHLTPSNPPQEWVQNFNEIQAQKGPAQDASERIGQIQPDIITPFSSLNKKTNKSDALSAIIAAATGGKNDKNKSPALSNIITDSTRTKTTLEVHQEHVDSLNQAYLNDVKDVGTKLQIDPTLDRKSLTPLMTYLLTTPPSLLSSQISAFEDERELYIFLHTIFIISTSLRGGLIDAVSALVHHTLQQHSLVIAESPLLRVLSNLLVKSMSSQWKQIEMLLHSNIAVVNHLAGLHQGL
jgi:hypothetical protein